VGEVVQDVSLDVRAGELVGLFGLVGAGRTELVRAIFGADSHTAGTIELDGRPMRRPSPRRSVHAGLGLAPEDRKRDGLVLDLPVRDNIALARIGRPDGVLYLPRRIRRLANEYVDRLDIKVSNVDRPVRVLSGGNQQRVVIAKWLTLAPRVLILDEPTQGVDVGAKAEIYRLIAELLADGIGVLMVSSDLPEVVRIADRILVMRHGRIVDELSHEQATEDAVGRAALGARPAATAAAAEA
jgi:ABC-type sugar transport system ATPase subunit